MYSMTNRLVTRLDLEFSSRSTPHTDTVCRDSHSEKQNIVILIDVYSLMLSIIHYILLSLHEIQF